MDAPEPVLVPVLPPRASRRRPVVALALALLVVAVAAYLAFQLSRSDLPQPPLPGVPARLAVVDTEGRLVTMDANGEAREVWDVPGVSFQFPAWAPDGSRVAAIGSDAHAGAVYVGPGTRANDDPEIIFSSELRRPFYLSWSPDAEHVTFLTNEPDGIALRLARADAASEASLVRRGQPLYWDWIDPARLLVHTGSTGSDAFLGEVDLEGTTLDEPTAAPGFFRAPGVSDMATHRAWIGPGADSEQVIHVEARDGSNAHEIQVDGSIAISFDPAATTLAFIASDRPTDEPPPLPIGPLRVASARDGSVRILRDGPVMAFFWSPDGRTIAALEFVDPDEGGPVEAVARGRVASLGGATTAAAQPSGLAARLLFVDVASGEVTSERDLRLSDLFAFQVLPFFDQYALSHRLWSPDSTRLALPIADERGPDRIVLLHAAGGDPAPLAEASIAFWSP